jgi:CheY-like chemotaxis protein
MNDVAGHPIKALIVDDSLLVSEAMQMILQSEGFIVDAAYDGLHALALLKQSIPDIVITDVVMPDMDGLEFIRAVRAINPDVPILAISGMGPEGGKLYLKQAEKLGADMTLSKPVNRERFLEAVYSLVSVQM